jgi:hypothetical protein
MTAWERRDRPLLAVLASGVPDRRVALGRGRGSGLRLDLDDEELFAGMLALRDAGFVAADIREEASAGVVFTNVLVTGRGMQALGEWPLFEQLASPPTLAALLDRLADQTADPDEAAALKGAANHVRSLGGEVLRAAARAALTHAVRAGLPGL